MVCSEAAMSQPVTGIFAELVNIGAVFGKDNDVVLDLLHDTCINRRNLLTLYALMKETTF